MAVFKLSFMVLILCFAIYYIPKLFEPKLLPIVEGYFQPEFMDVAMVLKRSMESGVERGGAFAVYYDGEPVIDMWMGYADRDSLSRWRNDTTTLTFGCTSGVMAILLALMVDKGVLEYHRPVQDFWPGFGFKEITVDMLLSHQAGFPYLDKQISLRDITSDPASFQKMLVANLPVWKPGSMAGFHKQTFGLYTDVLLQKIDSKDRTTSQIFTEEIALPFNIEYGMSLKPADVYRTSRLTPWTPVQTALHAIWEPAYLKMFYNYYTTSRSMISKAWSVISELTMPSNVFNNPELREITMSSLSGTGTARGLAKLYSILATGGYYQGKQLLSPEVIQQLSTQVTNGTCVITGLPLRYGRGVQIFKNPLGDDVYGHSGYGGQMTYADPTNKLSMSYLTNYLSMYRNGDDPRFIQLQDAVYRNLHKHIDRRQTNRS